MIAFLTGFAAVFVALGAWMLRANRGLLWQIDASDGDWWVRLADLAAPMLSAPVAGAWIGMELVTRLRPIRAIDPRIHRAKWLFGAGLCAGVLGAAGSAVALPFAEEWVPNAVTTGVLSLVFSALALLPFARRRFGHCIHCGYDLRGGALRATCPECGAVGSAA